jgi:hypothetical protein
MRSLAVPGLPMSHDSSPHVARIIAFHNALEDGQFPPAWAKDLMGGIGSPVLMVSYQLPYFIAELWIRLGFSYFDSYKLTLAISFILSGLAMYFALRQRFKILPSLMGALVFSLAPYRMVDIFVRGALGESLSFVFFPLILAGYYRKSVPWLIFGLTGLFLTHPLASAIFSVFFVGYLLFVTEAKERAKTLSIFAFSYIISFAISAFSLLPTFGLTKFTFYSPSLVYPLIHFPTLIQLISSPWGYGPSVLGPNDYMSFSLGIVQWGVVIAVLIYLFDKWITEKKVSKEILYFSAVLLASFLMMLSISEPVYKLLGLTSFIDYPWRMLLFTLFLLGWLTSYLFSIAPKKVTLVLAVLVLGILIRSSIRLVVKHPNYWQMGVEYFTKATGDDKGEYASKFRSTRQSSTFLSPIETVKGLSIQKVFRMKVGESSVVRVNTSYFPGWEIWIDGKRTDIDTNKNPDSINSECYVTTRTRLDIDDSGLMACHVNNGEHELIVKYSVTPIQKIGNIVSLFGIFAYMAILLRSAYLFLGKKTKFGNKKTNA